MQHLDDFSSLESLLSPKELQKKLPLSSQQGEFVLNSRRQISQVLDGKDSRILLIVGPCSIHDITAAKEYATKLRQLADLVSDSFLIVMRVYFEKPRTKRGWKGFMYDPLLDGSTSIEKGLHWARELLLDLAEMEIPTATEFLDPLTANYINDLISWACIGARTSESPIHRQMASGLFMPVAFKNNTSGNIDAAINGVLSAAEAHTFLSIDEEGHIALKQTKGNSNCHIVLRGGKNKPNFDPAAISQALRLLDHAGLPRCVVIDCSHDNCNKNHEKQIQVFESVINQFIQGNRSIRGILLESNLFAGNQSFAASLSQLKYAISITDPCLDWKTTEKLILWGNETIKKAILLNQNSSTLHATHALT